MGIAVILLLLLTCSWIFRQSYRDIGCRCHIDAAVGVFMDIPKDPKQYLEFLIFRQSYKDSGYRCRTDADVDVFMDIPSARGA